MIMPGPWFGTSLVPKLSAKTPAIDSSSAVPPQTSAFSVFSLRSAAAVDTLESRSTAIVRRRGIGREGKGKGKGKGKGSCGRRLPVWRRGYGWRRPNWA
jgi:hypothetical protein